MPPTLPRGIRNHNPGNIDRNLTQWAGMADEQTDSRFIVFSAPEYGIRALAKTLLTYQRKHGLNTVTEIIHRWAPPSENDTAAYVDHVAAQVGVTPDQRLDLFNGDALPKLVAAIIAHENAGHVYPKDVLAEGVSLALGKLVEV